MFLEVEQMLFSDRVEAGVKLARELRHYAKRKDVIVLGIPRGGVPVAFEVAKALNAPLDTFVSRKLGVPGQEELAFGAIASGGVRVLDRDIVEGAGITDQQIELITEKARNEVERREKLYRGDRAPLKLDGRIVILVDDGIATGSSVRAAIRALRQLNPAKIVLGVPVAPLTTCNRLKSEVDELVCVSTPKYFYAIGQFYADFSQVSDREVTELLQRTSQPIAQKAEEDPPAAEKSGAMPQGWRSKFNIDQREVSIELDDASLQGSLAIPEGAKGIVLFAHGSGSSRHSPRNQYVAQVLQSQQIGTLLFDLLTHDEESIDRFSGELRFDIPFLAKRLAGATEWTMSTPLMKELHIGYFGASTGAAAALVAAAELPDAVSAIVSRGGRPDLAGRALGEVCAPTLLIVGGDDEPVIAMNRDALQKLQCCEKKMIIVPGATHLFEEPGALEKVAKIAADWFTQHFARGQKVKPRGARAQAS